ncbi:MAG: type II secretion system protein [Synergistaceae bacterium]|nr:type II secretion system protein [Synergistaceae bacterium]
MRKSRKGFTLLELLVVIGVMGILSSTAMIAGQQATDAARATNIADGLEKGAVAMMMYYADNAKEIAVSGAEVADVVAGANRYLKSGAKLKTDNTTPGEYFAVINETDATWWIGYKIPENDVAGVGAILINKVARMELTSSTETTTEQVDDDNNAETPAVTVTVPAADYAGGDTVYMRVR